jgi:hypothetical protein
LEPELPSLELQIETWYVVSDLNNNLVLAFFDSYDMMRVTLSETWQWIVMTVTVDAVKQVMHIFGQNSSF